MRPRIYSNDDAVGPDPVSGRADRRVLQGNAGGGPAARASIDFLHRTVATGESAVASVDSPLAVTQVRHRRQDQCDPDPIQQALRAGRAPADNGRRWATRTSSATTCSSCRSRCCRASSTCPARSRSNRRRSCASIFTTDSPYSRGPQLGWQKRTLPAPRSAALEDAPSGRPRADRSCGYATGRRSHRAGEQRDLGDGTAAGDFATFFVRSSRMAYDTRSKVPSPFLASLLRGWARPSQPVLRSLASKGETMSDMADLKCTACGAPWSACATSRGNC